MSRSKPALKAGIVCQFLGVTFRSGSGSAVQVGKIWPGQRGLDLRHFWSTRLLMKIKALCTVRFLFYVFFPLKPAIIDAILFPTNAHFFVWESGHSVLQRDVLKRSVKWSTVFKTLTAGHFRPTRLPLGHNVLLQVFQSGEERKRILIAFSG